MPRRPPILVTLVAVLAIGVAGCPAAPDGPAPDDDATDDDDVIDDDDDAADDDASDDDDGGGDDDDVQPTGELWICTPDSTDPYLVTYVDLIAHLLVVDVIFSGGCEVHFWTLCWDGNFSDDSIPQVTLALTHWENWDECDSEVVEYQLWDVSLLDQRYEAEFGPGSGVIQVHLVAGGTPYTFIHEVN